MLTNLMKIKEDKEKTNNMIKKKKNKNKILNNNVVVDKEDQPLVDFH